MALEITTVGATVSYGIEATAGTFPSTFTTIPDVNSAPEISMTPSTIDVSNISDTVTRYAAGRADPGGIQNLTLNNTTDVRTKWAAFVTASATARAAGKKTYMRYNFPNGDYIYFEIIPLTMEVIPGIDQNALSTLQAPFLVASAGVWVDAA